jgi:hypothetical protein
MLQQNHEPGFTHYNSRKHYRQALLKSGFIFAVKYSKLVTRLTIQILQGMAKKRRKKKTTEELGAENELMKLKMMAEFGGDFVGNEDIPAEVENQFLKQIMSFHKRHEKSALTTVYKFIGEPEYNHVNDISDKEVKKELKQLLVLMNKNGVSLDVLAETPEREIYRFITEELFKHEIEEVRMKGWVNHFIYEEFHPNPDYDVRSAVSYCIPSIFNKGQALFEEHFAEDLKDNLGLTTDIDELKEKIAAFWAQFNAVKMESYKITILKMEEDKSAAYVTARVNYKTQSAKGKKFKQETTTVELTLKRSQYMDSWWEITCLNSEVLG